MTAEWALGSTVILLAALALRRALRGRICPRLLSLLWLPVLLRLLLPVSAGVSPLSAASALDGLGPRLAAAVLSAEIPKMSYEQARELVAEEYAARGVDISGLPIEEYAETAAYDIEHVRGSGVTLGELLAYIWAAGALIFCAVFAVAGARFGARLRRSRRRLELDWADAPVYVSAAAETPCLFGLLRPVVYVTPEAAADEAALRCAVRHELCHLRRGDNIWKALGCLCLAIHWFNPLAWRAARHARLDAELACDEAAVRGMSSGERAEYGRTLIALSAERRPNVAASGLCSDSDELKERISMLTKKSKSSLTALIFAALAMLLAAGCAFTAPPEDDGGLRADLDRDGENELISILDLGEELSGGYAVSVADDGGGELWRIELNLAHAGWGSVFLCATDEGDALLTYFPTMYQGIATYQYRLFSLEGGEEKIIASNELYFDLAEISGPTDEMLAFADELNAWLENSELLLSTLGGECAMGPADSSPYYEDYGVADA